MITHIVIVRSGSRPDFNESRQVSRVRLADSACGVESVHGESGEEGVQEDGGRQGEVMEGETQKECI